MSPGRILLSSTKIAERVTVLGREITDHYRGRRLLLLGIMNGALFFLADLVRAIDLETEIATIRLASYEGMKSTKQVQGLSGLYDSVRGRQVLIVDDILDTGHTLAALVRRLEELDAAEVKVCVLLKKRGQQRVPVQANWIGFEIANEFVVGYGLDYEGHYRTLQNLHVVTSPP